MRPWPPWHATAMLISAVSAMRRVNTRRRVERIGCPLSDGRDRDASASRYLSRPLANLDDARLLRDAALGLLERAIERARGVTESGKRIDDHQVLTERVAYAA